MTIFDVRHRTEFQYRRPVSFGQHRLLFRPRDSYDQRLLDSSLVVHPKPSGVRWIHDVFGNCVALIEFGGKADRLVFETQIRVDHSPQTAPEFRIDKRALRYPFSYDGDDAVELELTMRRQYEDPADEIGRWARQFLSGGKTTDTGKLLMTLCYAIRESFSYGRRHEQGTQPPLQTLTLRKGTCRDFALFMMEAVRSLGFAARFVSGYVYVADRDGQPTLGGGATHAWCQVYLPGAGWVEFDPTNGIVGNRDLIRVAVVRDPRQATPLSGSFFGMASDDMGMTVQVNVLSEGVAKEEAPAPSA